MNDDVVNVRRIQVDTVPPKGRWYIFANLGILFGYLITAEWLSHWLFGGSWVVDITILLFGIVVIVGLAGNLSGRNARLTHSEIKKWVDAGMPDNIKSWIDNERR